MVTEFTICLLLLHRSFKCHIECNPNNLSVRIRFLIEGGYINRRIQYNNGIAMLSSPVIVGSFHAIMNMESYHAMTVVFSHFVN